MAFVRVSVLSCLALAAALASTASASDLLRYYSLKEHTVAGVEPGGQIVIKTRDGDKVRGVFVERADEGLTVRDQQGDTRKIAWNNVDWVRCRDKGIQDIAPLPSKKAE